MLTINVITKYDLDWITGSRTSHINGIKVSAWPMLVLTCYLMSTQAMWLLVPIFALSIAFVKIFDFLNFFPKNFSVFRVVCLESTICENNTLAKLLKKNHVIRMPYFTPLAQALAEKLMHARISKAFVFAASQTYRTVWKSWARTTSSVVAPASAVPDSKPSASESLLDEHKSNFNSNWKLSPSTFDDELSLLAAGTTFATSALLPEGTTCLRMP